MIFKTYSHNCAVNHLRSSNETQMPFLGIIVCETLIFKGISVLAEGTIRKRRRTFTRVNLISSWANLMPKTQVE